MQDPWSAFPDAPERDEWAGFPDAEPVSPKPKKKKRGGLIGRNAPVVPERFEAPTATDGDTIRDGDFRLRLQGIDAPELGQVGYRSDGSTVPLGQQSQGWLSEQLYSPENLSIAAQAAPSFGRAVAPLLNDGRDVGRASLRAGQSYAAPEYIDNPDMRFDYLEAQRLGRQNRMGVHGTATLTPKEHRLDPDWRPDDPQYTARFADMPTPFAGLTADEERGWIETLYTGTARQIEDYARSVGMQIDEERNREWVKTRDKFVADGGDVRRFVRPEALYQNAPKILIDPDDGRLGAGARSYAGGVLFGALDELGAGADTLGLTPGRENLFNSDRRFGDIYWNNLAQNQSILGHDETTYPYTTTAGKLAGAFTSGFAVPYGAGVRSARGLATVGGAYGGAEGFLGTDGSLADRLTGTAQGVALGAVSNAALGKGLQVAAPAVRRLAQSPRSRGSQSTAPIAPQINDPELYSPESINMAAELGPSLSQNLRPPASAQPTTRAELLASTADIQPRDVLPFRGTIADNADGPFSVTDADWAADALDRIGNIDVSKLDSPQDISRALRTTDNAMGGFDAATRGRITQAETERLADDLGMTADKLLSRRQGQAFNAEEALAARQILAKSGNELVNAAKRIRGLEDPGDELLSEFREKLVRHTAIQEQVAGMTAEAGRTLQQFRQAANSRAVRGNVLGAFVRSGGGAGDLKNAADALIDAAELGPGKFSAVVRDAIKPKFRDKVSELYINALLSNPPTHVVNMVSNSLTAAAQIPEFAFASGIGAARRAVIGEAASERILSSEVGARTFGLVQGIKEGASLFSRALRTGEADDFVSKVEGDQYKAISGFKGEVIRIPTRLLTAEDQFFKGIARRMELNAQAVRIAHKEGLKGEARQSRIAELVANPTDDMLERAMDYGRYLTFQRQLGPQGQAVSQFTNNSLVGKVIAPFVRTPINLLKFATERSPVAPLLKEWRDDFRAGGERRDLAIAKSVIGTGFATLFYQAAQNGVITGAAPPDPKKARLMYADGWQPYSIKVGERYVSYARMDPFSTTMGVAADMASLPDGMSESQRDNMGTMLVTSIMGNLANKSWLSGVSAAAEAVADPQRYAENWMERTAGSFAVPAGVAGVARQVDPVLREREGVTEAIQSRVPGLSQDLFPRRDVFGEPIELDSLGPDFISPFWQSQSKDDPVIAEMLRLDEGVSKVQRSYRKEGERLEYDRETYDRYQELAGRFSYNGLLSLFASPGYAHVNDDGKAKLIERAVRNARKTARGLLDDPDYPLPPRGQMASPANDPWRDFPDADGGSAGSVSDPWDAFPDAEGG